MIERILRLRDQGLTRFAGVTGHGLEAPVAFAEALRRHDLDTVMFPVYPQLWADPGYRAAAETLLALCAERDVGVMAIKAVARRPWPAGDRPPGPWYEPWAEPAAVARGVGFALSTPGVHACCTPGDLALLPVVLGAAEANAPMSGAERDEAAAATAHEPGIFPVPA